MALSKFSDSAGAALYPTYIENQHKEWLYGEDGYPYNIKDYLEVALQQADVEGRFGPAGPGSPYYNATVYDPADDLEAMETRLEAYTTDVDALNPAADFGNLVDAAAAKKALVVDDAAAIDLAVAAFEEDEVDNFNGNLAALCGGMYEARATQSSNFAVGVFQAHARMRDRVQRHKADLTLQSKRTESVYMMQAVQQLQGLFNGVLEHKLRALSARQDLGRLEIVARKEFHEDELRMEVEDAFYELELFKYGNAALSSLAGLATQPPRLPRGQSALAGMLATAPVAVTIGRATDPAVGVGVALLGALSGWMGGS